MIFLNPSRQMSESYSKPSHGRSFDILPRHYSLIILSTASLNKPQATGLAENGKRIVVTSTQNNNIKKNADITYIKASTVIITLNSACQRFLYADL